AELQRHQKVRRFANAANEVVLHPDDRRRTGAGRDRDVIDAELVERVFNRERAAESHATVNLQVVATLERDANHLQEVLVPPNGDAVFGDAAEAGEDAIVELLPQYLCVAD